MMQRNKRKGGKWNVDKKQQMILKKPVMNVYQNIEELNLNVGRDNWNTGEPKTVDPCNNKETEFDCTNAKFGSGTTQITCNWNTVGPKSYCHTKGL